MTTTYDPKHPLYYDEGALRQELTRVYDLCHGCRLCFNLCPSFPTMFELIDANDGAVDALTPAEQDRVVDECYGCKLCYVKCPYTPPHEWQLDFPRLMLRAVSVRHEQGDGGLRKTLTDQALGRTDMSGKIGTALAPVANKALTPNSLPRKLIEKTVGIAADRRGKFQSRAQSGVCRSAAIRPGYSSVDERRRHRRYGQRPCVVYTFAALEWGRRAPAISACRQNVFEKRFDPNGVTGIESE